MEIFYVRQLKLNAQLSVEARY